jgi:putative ABC transport system ATP-binding protein
VTGISGLSGTESARAGYVVTARSLRLRRGGRELLSGAGLEALPGEITGVTGPSGSGKTALLMVLALLDRPDDGSVEMTLLLPGTSESSPGIGGSSAPVVGYVPQTLALVPHLTAVENVAVPLQARRLEPREIRDRSMARLVEVGLGPMADRVVVELSGGQRQRVAVARALALEPDVIVADEPTTELDAANRDLVLELIQSRANAGGTVIMASHDPDVVQACRRRLRLEGGLLRDLEGTDSG